LQNRPKVKKPLLNYSQSHVITSEEYIVILKKKPWTRQVLMKLEKQKGSKKKMVVEENN
jgi:hypothetical protein